MHYFYTFISNLQACSGRELFVIFQTDLNAIGGQKLIIPES